ncbi:MAG: AzlC family ABC transporter permease, partial [Rhodoferax sp.]
MLLQRKYLSHPEFRQGVTDMLGVATGIAAWGLMTGVAMVKSGMSTAEALMMAAIVFAGSAQLAAIPLILAGAPIWVVLATALCVNLRFVVFSVHLRPYVMHLPLRDRLFAGYLTGDLTYVLFVKRFAHPPTDEAERVGQIAYLLGNGGVNWLSWTSCSILGVVLANSIPA